MATETEPFVYDSGYDELNSDATLESHLAAMAFRGLASNALKKVVVDYSGERKELTGGMLLAVTLTLRDQWKDRLTEDRVGIVFPAGLGGIIATLAVSMLGKVPVNFNFTSGRAAVESCMEKSGVKQLITAGPIIEKLPDFPWPEEVIDIVEEQKKISKASVVRKLLQITVLPIPYLLRRFEIPTEGGDREGGLLFSSGSTGMPKGVPLTHRNVIGNCLQIKECRLLHKDQVLLACLPTFHSFGFTATLWYPLITGLKVVALPSPLETKKIAKAIKDENVTVLMGTPTFFRPYFHRVDPSSLQSLVAVVAGAEKTPAGFADKWESHFGSHYLEGYGLTETSPVVSVNLPPLLGNPELKKKGSVGRLYYGMQARVVNAAGQALPVDTQGVLQLKGVNVFGGYLGDPDDSKSSFQEDWFSTGDLARIDEEGFLFIEGRVSRFSKIGGEMVPHGQVEATIAKVLELEDAEKPMVAVTGTRDIQKGEALVLISAVDIDKEDLRVKLNAAGVPNLWIPKTILKVDEIPCLASGKLDLKGLNDLV